jgi:hypothetical protein
MFEKSKEEDFRSRIDLVSKPIVMNADNLNYLKNQLRFTGFGEALFGSLEEKMGGEEDAFVLEAVHAEDKDGVLEAVLYFGRSKTEPDRWFFNRYVATLSVAEEKRSHSFQIRQQGNLNISFLQAGHLLAGRPVYTDYAGKNANPIRKVWMELDLNRKESPERFRVNRYFESYGFDVETALEKTGLKMRIRDDQISGIIEQLQKGYKLRVLLKDGEEVHAVWLVAQPRFRSFSMYDMDGHLLWLPALKVAKEKVEAGA